MCSGGGEGLAAVAGGLDALAAEDLFAVPGPALLDRTAALVAARNRLDAELARTVRRAEAAGGRARRAQDHGLLAARALSPLLRERVPGGARRAGNRAAARGGRRARRRADHRRPGGRAR